MVLNTAMKIAQGSMVEMFVKENGLPPFALDVLCNEGDCNDFFKNFFNQSNHMTDNLILFKKNKIAQCQVTIEIFLESCYNGINSKAFEEAFSQSFSEEKMTVIKKALLDKKTTLEEVYLKFSKNPNRNIMRQFKF